MVKHGKLIVCEDGSLAEEAWAVWFRPIPALSHSVYRGLYLNTTKMRIIKKISEGDAYAVAGSTVVTTAAIEYPFRCAEDAVAAALVVGGKVECL